MNRPIAAIWESDTVPSSSARPVGQTGKTVSHCEVRTCCMAFQTRRRVQTFAKRRLRSDDREYSQLNNLILNYIAGCFMLWDVEISCLIIFVCYVLVSFMVKSRSNNDAE